MQDILNLANKKVCRADSAKKIVEIVHKGYITTIQFLDNGTVKIVNAEKTA